MAVTIYDVARAAGVSAATVSRAFAVPELLRDATLQRVLQAADGMGYQPSRTARRAPPGGGTGNLAVIVPDVTNPFFPSVLKGVQARAREENYSVFLGNAEENPRAEVELVRAMAKQVDGVIICAPRMSSTELKEALGRTRLVLVNRRVAGVPSVVMDNVGGMRQAIDHLAALGHRRIAYLGGPSTSWSNQERRRGLRRASRHGMAVVEFGPFAPVFEAGVHGTDLALAARLTAIVCYNDLMALGVLSRLADRRVRVPDEVSVLGFDDIPMAAMCSPALSTVAIPQEQAGHKAVDLLVELLARGRDRDRDTSYGMATQLTVRGSTAMPAGARVPAMTRPRRIARRA
ncbi:LacI family DNA-binding transcriptional regulator [Rugosimonospora africana]|uniref:LacI family transcriptional regulator n=1 Tax=Rugosimonospora africana TaxID=556532 RepID=A0A8J3QYJ0_9ACTN|nr:LacI family DNA-binding transcriptional regulator [Rugosimonospora africana]GIH18871.1 LacI family transcriptional regulator [Rugosimonospora africana]